MFKHVIMFVLKMLKFVRTKDYFFMQKRIKSKYFEKIFQKVIFLSLKVQSCCCQKPYGFQNYMPRNIKNNIIFLI
jgi:hypothetical protein